ncbi:MAG: 3-hydroxybutyryl-CoA dehydrogenase [Thermomicrobiales bacterium]
MKTIGVIGAGTMGAGIAQVAAASGLEVVLIDQAESWLQRGLDLITSGLDRQVEKGRLSLAERDAILTRVEGSTEYDRLEPTDLVIEAVNEQFETKRMVLQQVVQVVADDTILASNTSSISISALAGVIPESNRVIGMHFFNPVPVLKLVEVVRGLQTSDETVAATIELATRLGKTPVEIRDAPGFVANRLLLPMINEAIFICAEGVAKAEAIDQVMQLGAAHPMGPLALADMIGLDVCLGILEVLHHDFGDDKYRPAPLLRSMVAAGRLGRKSGEGFFRYDK